MNAVAILVILLRFTVAFAGAEPDCYTVDIVNPTGDIDLGNISVEVIDHETSSNKTTYHIDPSYNEMELINDLKVPLNNSCEYYTVTWNAGADKNWQRGGDGFYYYKNRTK